MKLIAETLKEICNYIFSHSLGPKVLFNWNSETGTEANFGVFFPQDLFPKETSWETKGLQSLISGHPVSSHERFQDLQKLLESHREQIKTHCFIQPLSQAPNHLPVLTLSSSLPDLRHFAQRPEAINISHCKNCAGTTVQWLNG